MGMFTIPIAALFAALIIGRFIQESGLRVLTTEQKGRFVEATSPLRKYGLLFVLSSTVLQMEYIWNF